jgi:hypothetical protein
MSMTRLATKLNGLAEYVIQHVGTTEMEQPRQANEKRSDPWHS